MVQTQFKSIDYPYKFQEDRCDASERAGHFQQTFLSRLSKLKQNPFAFGNLTVRSLLDLREHCLMEFDFHDPYMRQKQYENQQALSLLPRRLQELAQLDWEDRQKQLAVGMLAGNVFDWGAKEVSCTKTVVHVLITYHLSFRWLSYWRPKALISLTRCLSSDPDHGSWTIWTNG